MAQLNRAFVEERGDEVAIVDEDRSRTYAEGDERVNRLISAVRSAGIGVGDVVGVLCHNRVEHFEVTSALAHTGVVYVPVNRHLTAEDVAYVLGDAGASAVFADRDHVEVAAEAASRVPGVRTKIVIDGSGPDGFDDYEALVASGDPAEPADQSAGTAMFYTSGTTGRPKGVRSSIVEVGGPLSTVKLTLELMAGLTHVPPDGTLLIDTPLHHAGPYMTSVLAQAVGNRVVLRRAFDPAETLRLIDEHGITSMFAVPTHFVRLLRLPEEVRSSFDGASLRYVLHGGAPCPPTVKRQMIEWWGPVLHEQYSATEGAGGGTAITSEEWLERPGSVGRAMPTCEVLVVDDHGTRLGPGQDGRIYFKSLVGSDFEYHNAPDKTAGSHLEPGVYTFGDVGHLDGDGYLYLTDRRIDMVITGGVNVYPAEVEAVLLEHPQVGDVAVFGVPDEEFGEAVRAAVELLEGVAASPELADDLLAFARERLAGYQCPRSIDFVEELPRSDTGKLQKRLLRDPHWAGAARRI